MSKGEGAGQPQLYCTSCGAQVRPGHSFCTSCGASRSPEPLGPDPARSVSQPHGRPVVDYRNIAQGKVERLLWWFREQPLITKAAIVGLVLLVVLVVLGPISSVVSAIVVGVSFFALLVRVARHKPTRGWGITLVASLVLTLVFSGVSGVIYGESSTSNAEDFPDYVIDATEERTFINEYRIVSVQVATDTVQEQQILEICRDVSSEYPEADILEMLLTDRSRETLRGVYYLADTKDQEDWYEFANEGKDFVSCVG